MLFLYPLSLRAAPSVEKNLYRLIPFVSLATAPHRDRTSEASAEEADTASAVQKKKAALSDGGKGRAHEIDIS